MPYVKQADRSVVAPYLDDLKTCLRAKPENQRWGLLNYIVTELTLAAIYSRLEPPIGYNDFNSAIAALECAKLELYRRGVAPHEDVKIVENGDVYPKR